MVNGEEVVEMKKDIFEHLRNHLWKDHRCKPSLAQDFTSKRVSNADDELLNSYFSDLRSRRVKFWFLKKILGYL